MDDIKKILEDFNVDPYFFYESIINSTDDYLFIGDMTRDLSLVSDNMVDEFDLPGRLVYQMSEVWGNLIHEKDRGRFIDSMDRMMRGETDRHHVEYQILNRRNEYIWVLCRGYLKRDKDGNPLLFTGIITNLGNKGKIDTITGLFSQLECQELVTSILREGTGRGGILLLGLDDFNRINNLNNRIVGNMVLRQFAQDVQRRLPRNASIFRFDGDEFAIVYRDASEEEMEELYKAIHMNSNQRHQVDGKPYFCTVSGGLVMMGRDGDDYLDLIKYAASALEASKRKGKNTCTTFSSDLIQAKLRQLNIARQLQNSVMNGMRGFHMVYQPIADADTMKIAGAEALLRWSGEDDVVKGVSPAEFIPILEKDNLIMPVGKWVLEQAVKTCRRWICFCPDFVMNVNISYLQILDDGFLPFVERLLRRYELPPEHLVMEMTESYFVTDMEELRKTFGRLRELKIRLAMDDFGTGQSSLGLLAQAPADVVKIDRLFVTAINENQFNRTFIGAVIQMCQSVGMRVCVEGVETVEELKTVKTLNADRIQGFYVSRPIPSEEFEQKFWHAGRG